MSQKFLKLSVIILSLSWSVLSFADPQAEETAKLIECDRQVSVQNESPVLVDSKEEADVYSDVTGYIPNYQRLVQGACHRVVPWQRGACWAGANVDIDVSKCISQYGRGKADQATCENIARRIRNTSLWDVMMDRCTANARW